jgi:hypothetical protein
MCTIGIAQVRFDYEILLWGISFYANLLSLIWMSLYWSMIVVRVIRRARTASASVWNQQSLREILAPEFDGANATNQRVHARRRSRPG